VNRRGGNGGVPRRNGYLVKIRNDVTRGVNSVDRRLLVLVHDQTTDLVCRGS
jgi:hypothetical protein